MAIQTVKNTFVEMTQVVMPQYTNTVGTVFGGQIVSWIDICAAVSAQRHARTPVVTASIDSVNFIEPVKQGQVIILRSQINAVFKTSMEVGVTVIAESPLTGERRKACQAYCTFVSLDKSGKPLLLPKLLLDTPEEKQHAEEACKRRRVRLENRKQEIGT